MKKVFAFLSSVLLFCTISAQNNNSIEKYTSKRPHYGFIENKGQLYDQDHKANSDVKYLLSIGNGMNVQLKRNSFSYDTYRTEVKEEAPLAANIRSPKATMKEITYYFHRVDVELPGANANPEVIAEEPSADYLNYYNTATPESGATNVHNFKKITYKDIYPSIDMVFTAQADKEKPVEYTFVVHPGADAGQIQLHYKGANETQLTDKNKINIDVVNGSFSENIPVSWIKETNAKIGVTYKNTAKDVYSFDIPAYSPTQTLIIDPNPNLDWATYYGGSVNDEGNGIACDPYGNVFVTGSTNSNNNIATTGAYQTIYVGNGDAFVVKFNNIGAIQWGTYYGGSNNDVGLGIICDKDSGNVFITGYTGSSSGISTSGAYQAAFGGGSYDAFIVKFNNDGFRQWGTYYGGSADDFGYGIACNNDSGNVFITGYTSSPNAIATSTAYQPVLGGDRDAFVAKFNTNGAIQWGTYYGGLEDDFGTGVACDGSNVSIIGYTSSTNAMSSIGAHQTTFGGGTYDAFVAEFISDGNRSWGTYYGGSGDDEGTGITNGISGAVLITGFTNSTNGIYTLGQYQDTLGGGTDAFVVSFKGNGNVFWNTYYGGTENDVANGITCDAGTGDIFITGYTKSTSAIATNSSYQSVYGGGTNYGDAFVVRLTNEPNTTTRIWGTYYGGSDDEYATGVACNNGNAFITGSTESSNAIATTGAYQTIYGGGGDAFLARFKTCTLPITNIIDPTNFVCIPIDSLTKYTFYPSTLNDPPVNYIWTLPNGSIIDTSSYIIYVNFNQYVGDTVHISAYASNTCGNGDTITITIPVYNTPLAPIVTEDSDTLISNVAIGNQWWDASTVISGATNQTYVTTTNGDYYDIVTINGCPSDTSNHIPIITSIKVNVDNKAFKVYPNPVSNQLIIETEGNINKLYFEIFNSIGEVVYNGYLIDKAVVQTTNFAPGIYLIKLDNGKTFDFKKVVKE